MTDLCSEFLVKKKMTAVDFMLQGGIIILAAILVGAAVTFVKGLGAALAVVIIYGAYYLATTVFKEFEYIFVNGDIDFDVIVNKRGRKRLITVKSPEIEAVKPYVPAEHQSVQYQTVIHAEASKNGDNMCIVAQSGKRGKTLIVFTNNEKTVECLRKTCPRAFM